MSAPDKIKPLTKLPQKWPSLKLAFYNAPNLHTVEWGFKLPIQSWFGAGARMAVDGTQQYVQLQAVTHCTLHYALRS